MLCLPNACSPGGPAPLIPSLEQNSYHRPGMLGRARVCVRGTRSLAGSPLPAESLPGSPPVRFPCATSPFARWSSHQPPPPNSVDENIHFFSSVPLHFSPAAPLGEGLLPGDMSAGWESRHLCSSPSRCLQLTSHMSPPRGNHCSRATGHRNRLWLT